MNYKLISSIALSLLLARWKQTLVAAVGVMFSITMFIALLGFMNGLNDLLDGLILNRTAHVRLYSEVKINPNQPIDRVNRFTSGHNFIRSIKPTNSRQEIYNSQAILQAIRKDERVLGVAPKISAPLFFNTGTVDITGVVNGIDAEAESRLFHFADYVTEGRPEDIADIPNSIILGKALADKLMAGIGDLIYVTTPGGERFPLKVVGYFQSGIQEFDKTQSYASLGTTQKLFGRGKSYITDIQVKLNDLESAPAVAKEYQRLFQVDAEDIQTANSQFETGSFVRSLISYAVGITLLIVSGFGIYNILNMMIYEKMDSIAILKATGFSGKDVNRIFILIALSIGVSGGLAGLLFGLLASVGIDHIPFNTAALPTITTYPVNYDLVYYAIGLGFSLVTTYLAGLFPASKASHIDPVIIIRGK
ncbi:MULTISPECIES: ABC transporter permease [unclassified Imperialibacter]|uniref:ABC transporter permease n=1 Tax=unclassified Imperialibacter TaxID=2629706 RepID=UPI00125AE1B9|nr:MULTISPECIES: ABC transporter permease [unclassified Imperialibacter]CAD5276750.1 Lipoprotein-releasing system permease protein [Imperialibacter sp. 75]CAD5294808.1 Lipoprotein-releasing system permease protein [Imperialibacter sp. 89]VVT12368.1 Lipoprotein-releasing system permease protein [Imperialibacter sp. EC-SDR9]